MAEHDAFDIVVFAQVYIEGAVVDLDVLWSEGDESVDGSEEHGAVGRLHRRGVVELVGGQSVALCRESVDGMCCRVVAEKSLAGADPKSTAVVFFDAADGRPLLSSFRAPPCSSAAEFLVVERLDDSRLGVEILQSAIVCANP